MPVAEKFVSVNGEGRRAGRLASFVRFAGCNLACSYCDTRWACAPDCSVEELTVGEIVAFVEASPAACCTLTGGEPALQPLLPDLARALLALPPARDGAEGSCPRWIEVETNGSVDLARLDAVRKDAAARAAGAGASSPEGGNRLSFTMDWKLPSSGMEGFMRPENLALLSSEDAVKFVVGSDEDLEEMLRVVRGNRLCDRCSVYASPVFGRMEPARIAAFLEERGLVRATLQLQLHKIIWPNVERGV